MVFIPFVIGISLLFIIIILFVAAMMLVILFTDPNPDMRRFDSEKTFTDPNRDEKVPFPSIDDPSTVDMSVIVPAYNEEKRLPSMLDEALEYLGEVEKARRNYKYEVIVVDDGSSDGTTKTALQYSKKFGCDKVRVLTLEKNRGKGGAVRLGMLSARGKLLLFADADGASKFSDLQKLEVEMKKTENDDGYGVVCGSRAHLEKESVATRSFFRTILMYGFHFLVWFLCVRGIKDTQCGFKLLTRDAARVLFTNMHVQRWAFDVDMLHLAQRFKMPIGEVAISWQEIDGSKMVPIFSWLQMGKDLVLIRLKYLLGAWKVNFKPKAD